MFLWMCGVAHEFPTEIHDLKSGTYKVMND